MTIAPRRRPALDAAVEDLCNSLEAFCALCAGNASGRYLPEILQRQNARPESLFAGNIDFYSRPVHSQTGVAAMADLSFQYRHQVRVYYEDTDAGGIVYHASYLRFAERARTEALREAGAPHAELTTQHGLILVVRRVDARYQRPARLDDLLTVVTTLEALGGASVRLMQAIANAGGICARLSVDLACIRATDGVPARLPDRWRQVLAAPN
jgi:acyl-CoA thioester hydrolase